MSQRVRRAAIDLQEDGAAIVEAQENARAGGQADVAFGAWIVPVLLTCAPSNSTAPPVAAVIAPALTTCAAESPLNT